MARGFRLTGTLALDRVFRDLPVRVGRKVARQEARSAARPILSAARALVPVADEDGGDLRRSLKIRAVRRSRKLIGVNVQTATPAELGDQRARYPGVVEWGAPDKGDLAQPFLTPALENRGPAQLQTMLKGIRDGLEKEAAALGKSR